MTSPGSAPVPQHTPPAGALRVSDVEREQAVEMLQQAYSEGRIDHLELDHRIENALAASDRADLSTALRGLPLPERSGVAPSRTPSVPRQGGTPTGEERSWALLAHWSGLFTLFVGPVLIALTRGQTSHYVRTQAWDAANFQLTFIGANVAVGMATAFTFGIAALLFVPLLILWFVLMGVGGLSAGSGNHWRYPWNVRLLG